MWKVIWENFQYRIIGLGIGFGFGLIYLCAGFFKTIIFSLFLWIGYQAGRQRERNGNELLPWKEWVARGYEKWKKF